MERELTRDELEGTLSEVKFGQGARIPYDVFELIFPPGVHDDGAKNAPYDFARRLGLKIDNRPDDDAVWFYREG